MSQPPTYETQDPYRYGYDQPTAPVTSQPQVTHTTNVIVQQPMHLQQAGLRSWTTGTFSCFEDIPTCLLVAFCGPFYECWLSSKMGESCCIPMCVPGAMVALRARFRAEERIEGSIMNDCCMLTFCGPCTICQLKREFDHARRQTSYQPAGGAM